MIAFIRSFLLTLRVGIKSVLLHKLRSSLTVLGILIGVTAVIWLVAMGEGVSYEAQRQIKSLGATSVIIRSVKPSDAATGGGSQRVLRYGVTRDDFERIRTTIPAITQAVPVREVPPESTNSSVRFMDRRTDCRLVGCTPEYFPTNQLEISQGRALTDVDVAEARNCCVLAYETAQILFPYEDPIDRSVQVGTDFYIVVGVTESRTPSAAIGGSLSAQDYNKDVYIPLSTLRFRIGDTILIATSGTATGEEVELSQITLKVGTLEEVDSTAAMCEALLSRFHPVRDYAITVPKELLRQAEILRTLFNVLLVIIAGISLVVGGIGIMNIMLATVTERTREIGIRRALGATRGDILWQFLCETLVLSLTGGLLGVFLGLMCAPSVAGIQAIAQNFEFYGTLPESIRELTPRVNEWSIVASLLLSTMVGLVFGIYPAYRAAQMDPIEALRHE